MSMVGTFDGFTSARLGIYAAQHGLRTTGNNISNINTSGYTRQRVDQYSLKVGTNDMYRSFYDNHIGAGALVKSISQIRDPYLDIRYRNVSNDTYHYDTWLAGLQNIASILDEVGKGENEDGLLYRQLQDLAEKLRAYGNNPTDLNERLVRNSATSLTSLFHSAANNLQNLFNETEKEFNENIDAVNEILINIRDLNKAIREAEIHGDTALEMRDERNRQIDALSQYLDIKVEYSYEDVGAGVQVEKLTISLNNKNPDSKVHSDESVLVDGLYATQLSVPDERPVVNTYKNDYLKNYTYLREVCPQDVLELQELLDSTGAGSEANLVRALDENGNEKTDAHGYPIYIIGTNDPDVEGLVTEKNDNYSIHLSELVNAKGELWENSTTRWEEVAGTPITFKRYGFTVDGSGLNADTNNQFTVDGITYTIVASGANADNNEVNLADIQGNKFAAFIAKKLEASGKYSPEYTVSAKNGQIIFTATETDSTAAAPTLNVTPTNAGVTVTDDGELSPKVEYGPPTDIDPADYPQYKYDEHGNVIQTVTYTQVDGKWYRLQIDTEYTHAVTLDDNDLRGILQAQREMLTEEGEFSSEKDLAIDEDALLKRGLPYYMKSLDLLAQKFAEAYNQLNQGYAYNQDGYYIDENGNPLMLDEAELDENGNVVSKPVSIDGLTEGQKQNLLNNGYILKNENGYAVDKKGNLILDKDGEPIEVSDDPPYIDPENYDKVVVDFDRWMTEQNAIPKGGVLFSNRGDNSDPSGITAANISISAGWSNGEWNVVHTFEMLFANDGSGGLTNSTQPSNINHMIAMIEKSLTYDPRDLEGSDAIGPVLFEGCFNDMLSNMMSVEGEDASITNVRLTTAAIRLEEIDYGREGVSGVDLNDEAMNMITYQKAMGAAMRLMTTIDEMLDRLINNTGIAGR